MDRSTDLNPHPWRDEDARRRMSVPAAPADLTGALRASYDVVPLPAEMARLLERLR